jgi:hypothetical protein
MVQDFGRFWVFGGLIGLCLSAGSASAEMRFERSPTQYIAALGDSAARSGTGAETWGFWEVDPGPRGVWSKDYAKLLANGGMAPAGWQFDPASWWLEEHGLIMEAPRFPLPPGHYVVTGGREATAVLTVEAADSEGHMGWSLSDGASIYDVTHLGCRAAVYTAKAGAACTPDRTPTGVFPMDPGRAMPEVEGCETQDYQVMIVTGRMVEG